MSLCKRSNIFIQVNTDNSNRFAVTREEYNKKYYDMFMISANFVSYEYLSNVRMIFEVDVNDYGSVDIIRYLPCSSVKCAKMALLELFLFYLHTRRNYSNDRFTSKFNPLRRYDDASNLIDFVGMIGVNLYSHAISLERDFHYVCNNTYTTHRVATLMKNVDKTNMRKHPNLPLVRFVAEQFDEIIKDCELIPDKNNCDHCYDGLMCPVEKASFVDVGPDMEEYVNIPSTMKAMYVDKKLVVLPYSGKCLEQDFSVAYMVFVLTNIMYACSGNVEVFNDLVGGELVSPVDLVTFVNEYKLDPAKFNENDFKLAMDFRSMYFGDEYVPMNELIELFSRHIRIVTSVHAMYIPKW